MSAAMRAAALGTRAGAGAAGTGPDKSSIPVLSQGIVRDRGARGLFVRSATLGPGQLLGPCRHGGTTSPADCAAALVAVPENGDPWIVCAEGWSP